MPAIALAVIEALLGPPLAARPMPARALGWARAPNVDCLEVLRGDEVVCILAPREGDWWTGWQRTGPGRTDRDSRPLVGVLEDALVFSGPAWHEVVADACKLHGVAVPFEKREPSSAPAPRVAGDVILWNGHRDTVPMLAARRLMATVPSATLVATALPLRIEGTHVDVILHDHPPDDAAIEARSATATR